MSFQKFAIVAIMAASAFAAAPASADVYDFSFLSRDNVLNITDGTFTTDASNNILSAAGTLTSTDAGLLSGFSALSFTLAPGSGGGSQVWTNVYDSINNRFAGTGLGILLTTGNFSSIYDVSGYASCPGQTCISVDPQSNGAAWDPGSPGVLSISNISGAVPEPATWAMMLLGFGGIGFMLRGARRQPVAATA